MKDSEVKEEARADFQHWLSRLRGSIRWLMEAKRFKNEFSGDTWKDDGVAEVAREVYQEAVADVVHYRAKYRRAKERLLRLESNE